MRHGASVRCVLLLLASLFGVSGAGRAQTVPDRRAAPGWSWEALAAADGVDAAALDWLRTRLDGEEAAELFALVGALSRPDAAGLLTSYFEADPSYAYLLAWPALRDSVDAELEALRRRPPAGIAGGVEIAYRVGRIRRMILDRYRELPYYRYAFAGDTLRVPSAPRPPDRFALVLDFGPAAAVLDVLDGAAADAAAVRARLRPWDDVFDALLRHRSQDFYPVALTREALELSLRRAADASTLARLYRFAFPVGLLHFAEVRERLPAYRRLVDTLEARRDAIAAHVAARILPYAPADVRFSRTVHFVFADGADGWASDGVAAVDLEYFKDDFDRLLGILTHETFHALQNTARREAPRSYPDRRGELLADVLERVYREGTASFVAPTQAPDAAERDRLVEEGCRLLEALYRTLAADSVDEARVRELRGRGVQGGGPFYWLGARMTGIIVDELGPEALGAALREGGVRFFELYLRAAARTERPAPAFDPELVRAVEALAAR